MEDNLDKNTANQDLDQPKRKRGRPPKIKDPNQPPKVKKPRGRPPGVKNKLKTDSQKDNQQTFETSESQNSQLEQGMAVPPETDDSKSSNETAFVQSVALDLVNQKQNYQAIEQEKALEINQDQDLEQAYQVEKFDIFNLSKELESGAAKKHWLWRWSQMKEPDQRFNQELFDNPKEIIKQMIEHPWLKQLGVREIIFQIEQAPTTKNIHAQGYLCVNKKVREKTININLNSTFFGIQLYGARDVESSKQYVQKLETRVSGPYFYPEIYEGEDVRIIDENPYPWQTFLLQIIKTKPTPRIIHWVVDFTGGKGKSTFIKNLCFKDIAHMLGFEASKDLAQARRVNQDKNVVLMNFTRSIPKNYDIKSLYYAIESMKDGLVFSAKYDSKDFITKIPHVICFSNTLPDPELLSFDRWKIWMIDQDNNIGLLNTDIINNIIQQEWEFVKNKYKNLKPQNAKQNWYIKHSSYKTLWRKQTSQFNPFEKINIHLNYDSQTFFNNGDESDSRAD